MRILGKPAVFIGFAAGMICGLAVYHATLKLSGFKLINGQILEQQRSVVAELEEENRELTEELFRPRGPLHEILEESELPYGGDGDASSEVAEARATAMRNNRFLMVTFGANWCPDCRNLHWILHRAEVQDYTRDLFQFLNVDVGKFDQNRQVAADLGVSLNRGIPVAVFFDQQGQVIGTTNEGQLEPARHYSSKQILKFVRDIAEQSRILAPDAVE